MRSSRCQNFVIRVDLTLSEVFYGGTFSYFVRRRKASADTAVHTFFAMRNIEYLNIGSTFWSESEKTDIEKVKTTDSTDGLDFQIFYDRCVFSVCLTGSGSSQTEFYH